MGSILIVQHVPEEGLGRIAETRPDEAPLDVTHDFARIDDVDGLVVLGGPMGVYETAQHPRLLQEMKLIERALARRIPMLGVCLGSQLLAHVLGARVFASGRLELGWHEVELDSNTSRDPLFAHGVPRIFHALHWHGDVFELPKGAVHLARSKMTDHQAFSWGGDASTGIEPHAWGLLFHLEARAEQVRAMANAFPADVNKAGTTTDTLVDETNRRDRLTNEIAAHVFGAWREKLARDRSAS